MSSAYSFSKRKGIPHPICTNPQHNFQAKATKFKQILFNVLQNKKFHHIICWSTTKEEIEIKIINEFVNTILFSYFGHKNLSCFSRHMHMTGFHRLSSSECYSRKCIVFRSPKNFCPLGIGSQHVRVKIHRQSSSEVNQISISATGNLLIPKCGYCIMEHIRGSLDNCGVRQARQVMMEPFSKGIFHHVNSYVSLNINEPEPSSDNC